MRIFIFAGGQDKESSEGPISPSCRETDPPSYHVPASPLHRYRTYKAQCCGSGRFIPDPNFFHPGSTSKNLSILTQKLFSDPDPDFLPIPDPGSSVKKALDPGSGSATLIRPRVI
jgi:hypothetical protein